MLANSAGSYQYQDIPTCFRLFPYICLICGFSFIANTDIHLHALLSCWNEWPLHKVTPALCCNGMFNAPFIRYLRISARRFPVIPLLVRPVGALYGWNTRHKTSVRRNKYGCIPRHVWLRVILQPEKRVFWQKCALLQIWIKQPVSLAASGLRLIFVVTALSLLNTL